MPNNSVMLCNKFKPLLNPVVSEVVEPSGRSSGKSTANEVVAVTLMLQSSENNIWYCRAESGDIRSTVFTSLWSTIQMMGADAFFKTSLSPMQITCLTTGAVCYFSGINGKTDDDLTATKGFTPQRKSLAMCILDEAEKVLTPIEVTIVEKRYRLGIRWERVAVSINYSLRHTLEIHKEILKKEVIRLLRNSR